jgi:hypothetical protein
MRAFSISVNGKHLCTAGIGPDGVLTSNVTWSGRESHEHFHMHVGGLDSASNKHLHWAAKKIGIGDEILTRIIETEKVDDPIDSQTRTLLEAAHEESRADQTASVIAAALILHDSESGGWERQGRKYFTVLPRIGEYVVTEYNRIRVIAKIFT